MKGSLRKLKAILADPIQYVLPLGEDELTLNEYLGKPIQLIFQGVIHCIYCQQTIKKSYQQGYCFPCAQKLARCDLCIVQPEKCHFHLGTCREPTWGEQNCFIPHIVYLANTSALKIGITRETEIPRRWIDQGAVEALPIFRVESRYKAGLIEQTLKKNINDKTNWRVMLQGNIEKLDFAKVIEDHAIVSQIHDSFNLTLLNDLENLKHTLNYPVLEYPKKITSLGFEKQPTIEGTLLGIKGQYLILDTGVINIRKYTGFTIAFKSKR